MAQRTSKLFLGIIRRGIQRHSGENVSTTKGWESSHILQANPKAFSYSLFGRGATPVEQLGNVNSSRNSHYSLLSNVAKAIGGARAISLSTQGGLKVLARSSQEGGVQKFGPHSNLQRRIWSSHSKVKHEVNLLTKDSGGVFRGRRSYYVDRQGMEHFKRRGWSSWTERFGSQKNMVIIVAIVGGVLVIYYAHLEVVPYTHRKHVVLISPRLEKAIGDQSFEMLMKEYKGRLLPPFHPQSLRVRKIAEEIIEALYLGVGVSDYKKPDPAGLDIIDLTKELGPLHKITEKPLLEPYGTHTHTEDEIMDELWVDKSREDGLQKRQHGYTKHLKGMEWKVVVVDDDIVNAICIPGGKIVVFTGLLKKFRADYEVATVIGHEVGHAVARHSAEGLTQNLFIIALQLVILSVFFVPEIVNSISELLFRLPFSRRMEIEADHIGLILMAAAGHDPRLAPTVYERLGQLENLPEYAQYLSTHPSGKRRSELLRKSATMQEALKIYQQRVSGIGIEEFF
ncbi:unnamed protein product [Calypogeia fissa]